MNAIDKYVYEGWEKLNIKTVEKIKQWVDNSMFHQHVIKSLVYLDS